MSSRGAGLLLALGAACAHAPPPTTAAVIAAPLVLDAALFEGEHVTAMAADLPQALARPAQTRRIRRVGWATSQIEHHNCHTQAITIAGERVLTSCVDRRNGVAWLQIYRGRELAAFADASTPEHVDVVRLRDSHLPHPAVGQAVRGIGANHGAALVPIAYENLASAEGRPRGPSLLELRDADGQLMCRLDNPREGGLAASALTVHRGRFWAVAVNQSELLVWRVDEITDKGGPCNAELVHAARANITGDDPWERYQGIALIIDRMGEVVLLGGRAHTIDAWWLAGFGGSQMRAHRLARMRWYAADAPVRGMFREGMTVEQRDDGRLRIWAVPGDYWRGVCLPAGRHRRCARSIYYVDQPLAPRPLAREGVGPARTE